ncbi:hypothetical protein TOT_030000751 [Theileria orientalis strain Shintoku]|uniref:Uncharacterized protein n=1 Tax=Theileria orientalis strain Shintoku TaxID=869250 RepID=J4DPY0_THEOR|nr:hypothetical protein TOT_030000751 [Theileria orientalis strain Shintoku]BAM41489.1 hypothetical protein TOT_030000751 [Theileria orientalis strain Shintoku]|eukprot:XP_009691790.1 hypothetical protein TOT_030000751 [Theileria orientalis strain Shintoku]
MGGIYSDLNVYFHSRKGKYSGTGYTVSTKLKRLTGCSCFFERCYEIKFTNGSGLRHNVILYDSSSNKDKNNYVFAYCHPGNPNEVVKKVHVYYSVLAPEHPLVISFETEIKKYDCYYKLLKTARWDYASHITEYSIDKPVDANILDDEFKKLTLNKKIKLTTESDNKFVTVSRHHLSSSHFRFTFISKGVKSVMGSKLLFSMDFDTKEPKSTDPKANANKNQIDPYFLHSVKGHFFDGIIVYFERKDPKPKRQNRDYEGTALLIEFIDSTNGTIQFMRKDNDGYCWSEEKVDYNEDKKLITKLNEIKGGLDNNSVTVIIDETSQYFGVQKVGPGEGKVCKKYTHEFNAANNPKIIFKRKTITITAKGITGVTAKKVEVYYLNAGGKEDTQPFLIVFHKEDNGKAEKAYHFINTDKFEEWVEFNKGKPDGIEKKVEKIEQYCACLSNITTVRWYAHQILIGEEPPPPKPEEKTTPTRPKVEEPKPPPEEPPVWLIVGCVAAGVVVIVTSVVVYGIYWYNTTIKLLT